MKVLCVLFGIILCKKSYLIQVNNNNKNSLSEENNFYMNEAENIKDTFNIKGLKGLIMTYNTFPYHLYNYEFVELVEEDHQVNIEEYFESSFLFDQPLISEKEFNELDETKAYYMQQNPIWNLDRLDQRSNHLNDKYYYVTSSGENIDVYIVDTGIDISHPEFKGKAYWGFNSADNINNDCNGHGTHVAGSVVSETYGVVKKSNLIAVKVLNCKGSGSYSGVISGLEYVVNKQRATNKTSIVNMSLGGPYSKILNKVLAQVVDQGIHVIVAAGNENSDACHTSPASEVKVMAVGATTKNDEMASFSNWGKCVDILSPGTEIKSTYPNGGTAILQGTSMSAPQIAGIYALILSENPTFSPELMKKLLTTRCSKEYITKMKQDTYNCLAYSLS